MNNSIPTLNRWFRENGTVDMINVLDVYRLYQPSLFTGTCDDVAGKLSTKLRRDGFGRMSSLVKNWQSYVRSKVLHHSNLGYAKSIWVN